MKTNNTNIRDASGALLCGLEVECCVVWTRSGVGEEAELYRVETKIVGLRKFRRYFNRYYPNNVHLKKKVMRNRFGLVRMMNL